MKLDTRRAIECLEIQAQMTRLEIGMWACLVIGFLGELPISAIPLAMSGVFFLLNRATAKQYKYFIETVDDGR